MQMAFMNSAYTITSFVDQVSFNLMHAKTYLSKMYGDYSDPEGNFSDHQVTSMKSIIKVVSSLLSLL